MLLKSLNPKNLLLILRIFIMLLSFFDIILYSAFPLPVTQENIDLIHLNYTNFPFNLYIIVLPLHYTVMRVCCFAWEKSTFGQNLFTNYLRFCYNMPPTYQSTYQSSIMVVLWFIIMRIFRYGQHPFYPPNTI